MELKVRQCEILEAFDDDGLTPDEVMDFGREFDQLERLDLVAYWQNGLAQPIRVFHAVLPGRWYLTLAGATAVNHDASPSQRPVPRRSAGNRVVFAR